MVAQSVEWVLVVFYGPAAHQATYGRRVRKGGYTKDFIQLSRKKNFVDVMTHLFSVDAGTTESIPLTYRWPLGDATGSFVFRSSDRPHLKWETIQGAPPVWKMVSAPSELTPQTMPGNPSHLNFEDAEKEFALLASRGAGQPYLMAIKLRDEPRTLHLRTYLGNAGEDFAWADLGLAPPEIQDLASKTSQHRATAWSMFHSGVYFDPARNHDAWSQTAPTSTPNGYFLNNLEGDAAAETLESDPAEVEAYLEQIETESYAVADSTATTKTRGSAQRAFAQAVKSNYGYRCAITGISTKDFLVASHIVPWCEDETIRLDPTNGICLSLLVDRAFEKGYLSIADDLIVSIAWSKVGEDEMLRSQLAPYEGRKLAAPTQAKKFPRPSYLQRRRALALPAERK